MSDDRANRLRERRRSSKSRAVDRPADTADEETNEEAGNPDAEQSEPADGTAEEASVKEEQVGTYMYLPESQKRELKRVFNVLKAQYEYEYDEEFEKNRHFYPLLVQHGIETLDGADPEEVRELLADLRGG